MIDKCMNEYLVGNIKTTKTGAELRIISIEKPTEDAVAVEKIWKMHFYFILEKNRRKNKMLKLELKRIFQRKLMYLQSDWH